MSFADPGGANKAYGSTWLTMTPEACLRLFYAQKSPRKRLIFGHKKIPRFRGGFLCWFEVGTGFEPV